MVVGRAWQSTYLYCLIKGRGVQDNIQITVLRRSRDKIVSHKCLAQSPDLCYNSQCTLVHNPTRWRSTQVAEGDGLLNR